MSDHEISDSARRALMQIAEILRDGFSGSITLHCNRGGVSEVEQRTAWKPTKENGRHT